MTTDPADQRRATRAHLDVPPTIEVDIDGRTLHLVSAWGLFSAKAIDEGTRLILLELQALEPPTRILDLGCGYGAIGLTLAALWPESEVVLVDKDQLAVETASANIEGNQLANATVVLSPGFRDAPPGPYDLIVSNLPAQAGNEALDEILLDAYDHLSPGGSLVVVVVLGLRRYLKRRLGELFGNYNKAKQGARHVVAEAVRPDE
ncbi:MAG: methyltransferase [Chloroflexi bacterium]|nr:methyltransferase [Chloroflexota bacterium]